MEGRARVSLMYHFRCLLTYAINTHSGQQHTRQGMVLPTHRYRPARTGTGHPAPDRRRANWLKWRGSGRHWNHLMATRLSGIFTRLSITLDSTSRFSEPTPHTGRAELPNMLMVAGGVLGGMCWLVFCHSALFQLNLATFFNLMSHFISILKIFFMTQFNLYSMFFRRHSRFCYD